MAAPSFSALVKQLQSLATSYDATSLDARRICLANLHKTAPTRGGATRDFHDTLLFYAAHPANARELKQVELALARVAAFIKREGETMTRSWSTTGLPFIATTTQFSHDCVRWLLDHAQCNVALDYFEDGAASLNDVLKLTLPSMERSETMVDNSNDELLDALGVRKVDRLRFIVDELAQLDALPYVKDQLFDSLGVHVRITPTQRVLSRAYNRLSGNAPFFHDSVLRKFDPHSVLNAPLPGTRALSSADLAFAMHITKNTMLLTERETDPATYMDARTFRLFDLERGITIALFGMVANRQLPLESYVGFTLFKNGFPAAYGGAWVFGKRARFGMNIFEPFRGGESGMMMCQTLRAYRQQFGVDYVEVEPSQYGLDNPDGIASGAYWFYFKHGFRSVEPKLASLAQREHAMMQSRRGYRSGARTLMRFTESNVALRFSSHAFVDCVDVMNAVSAMIRTRFHGDRVAAVRQCLDEFRALTKNAVVANSADEAQVESECALVRAALNVNDQTKLDLLREMMSAKPCNLDRYQELVTEFFHADSR